MDDEHAFDPPDCAEPEVHDLFQLEERAVVRHLSELAEILRDAGEPLSAPGLDSRWKW
jgi:hypothetical protein